MNGKIILAETGSGEFGGFLVIDRPQGPRSQSCPYQQSNVRCGDWCPRFGEPIREVILPGLGVAEDKLSKFTTLEICHGKVLTFEEFTDERVK